MPTVIDLILLIVFLGKPVGSLFYFATSLQGISLFQNGLLPAASGPADWTLLLFLQELMI